MKKLFATTVAAAALLAAMASPALADDAVDPRAYSFALATVYDGMCERLPPLLMEGVALEMNDIPATVRSPASNKVMEQLDRLGRAEFCSRAKPLINKALDTPRDSK